MKNNRVITVIWCFAAGMLCALLLELFWFYCLPIPLELSKKIVISYYMSFPKEQLSNKAVIKEYPRNFQGFAE